MRNAPIIINYQSDVFLWIYRPIHGTDLFIVNGADLEST